MRNNGVPAWLRNAPSALQDIHTRLSAPNDYYNTVFDPNVPIAPHSDVKFPHVEPCEVEGMARVQEVIDCHLIPRQIQLMKWQRELLKCGTYFVRNPNWHQSPITARSLDLFPDPAVLLPGAPGSVVTVIDFTVPDRFVAILQNVGMELEDPSAWGGVRFSIQINEAPIPNYGAFTMQLGRFTDPAKFAIPIIINGGGRLTVTATNIGFVDHEIFFRIQGYEIPLREVTDDGSFDQWHVG